MTNLFLLVLGFNNQTITAILVIKRFTLRLPFRLVDGMDVALE
jgi:hypothetical protein